MRPVLFLTARLAVAVCVSVLIAGAAPSQSAANSASTIESENRAPLPAILRTVESSAEDIVDYALSGSRGNVIAEAAKLRSVAVGPATTPLSRAGVTRKTIALLEQRSNRVVQLSRSGPLIRVALAANAVSQLMPDLYVHFRNRVPPAILRLDYLDREAQLRSFAREPTGVARAIAGLEHEWPRVRKKVVAAGGTSEAAAYGRHVAAMTTLDPGAGRRVQEEAARGLELVDQLERVFEQ